VVLPLYCILLSFTGQTASVQLDAFNYIKYGAIDGVVENIYQDFCYNYDIHEVIL
jgi:hypothetical protein